MTASEDHDKRLSADDALPPVEPPSAGFIVQLFVIPGVIVVVIVLVSLLFNWLAHMESNPQAYIDQIERGKANSWQAAHDLAVVLSRDAALRRDPQLAGRLASLLEKQLAEPLPADSHERDNHVHLLVYLTKALGEFQVPTGLPVLLKAAQTARGEDDIKIRAAALESLATLSDRFSESEGFDTRKVLVVLQDAAADPSHVIRQRAAFALGVLGGSEAESTLSRLLVDAHPDVRFNAATGLARHGSPEAVEVLAEMLAVEENVGVAIEEPDAREAKLAGIVINALRAIEVLAERNPEANLQPLEDDVRKLLAAANEGHMPQGATQKIRIEAGKVLRLLEQRRGAQAAAIGSPLAAA